VRFEVTLCFPRLPPTVLLMSVGLVGEDLEPMCPLSSFSRPLFTRLPKSVFCKSPFRRAQAILASRRNISRIIDTLTSVSLVCTFRS
jgi:hypothetical protein